MKKYPKRVSNIVYRTEESADSSKRETLVFNPETGEIKLLNDTATFVWNLCDGKHSVEDIATRIIEEYDIDYNVCKSDLTDLLHKLEEMKLIYWKEGA